MPIRTTWRHAILLLAMACIILMLGCGLGGVAVRRGHDCAAEHQYRSGNMRVIGISLISPECTRLIIPGCIGLIL